MNHLLPYFVCTFLAIFALLFYFSYKSKKFIINRWQKSLNLTEHAPVFYQLYRGINGFLLSRQARQHQDAMEYVYGEIEFLPFIALLSLIKPDTNTVFYDLGSGTGKAVLACGMVYPVKQCVGIELFPELYFEACRRHEQLAVLDQYKEKAKNIRFILADFLLADLNDATLIFINSTAFLGSTWEKICFKLEYLPHLDTVITISKPLISTHFSLNIRTKIEMSWGVVFANIYTRQTNCVEKIE